MANMVYGNGTSQGNGQNANNVTLFYDKTGIKAANEMNIYARYASSKDMPLNYGKTYKISKFLHILDDANTNGNQYGSTRDTKDVTAGMPVIGEGAEQVNQVGISKVTIETGFARYGNYLEYTDEVLMFSEDKVQIKYREELGYLAGQVSDDLTQLELLSGTNVQYGGSASSRATVGENSDVSFNGIRKAARTLSNALAPRKTTYITGSTKIDTQTISPSYVAICGSNVKYDLETLTDSFSSASGKSPFIPARQYASSGSLLDGEFGAVHETRFVLSNRAMKFSGQGAPVTGNTSKATTTFSNDSEAVAARGAGETAGTYYDVFPVLYISEDAFATVGIQGNKKIKFRAISPDNKELNNPYGTKGLFSYNFWFSAIILRQERLLRYEVSASM